MRTYRTAIVTPVATNPSAELALRRLASRCPTGRTIGVYRGFEALVAAELPGIEVDTIGDELSPAWIPLPMEALSELCAGTDDDTVIPDELVAIDNGAWFARPRPMLAYVTQRQGDEVW